MKKNSLLDNQLHLLRAKHKLSQKQLAELVGVSRQTINSIESNRYNPSLVLAFKIASTLKVDINEVFQYKEDLE
ncbi:helix-turn-helix transcriptional regulator [Priestia endophytica]|uniref:helix-turn-helix transcriptional regulator n=1 Tax=Priestia endophytica TaxID=135735 RepID=UPI00124EFA05|nr:helix-turn-helix transcriptional regulator [Priestia endophytica]KAB2489467.1 helix-turn-helix transcriptional regulator [Priestia endophytica]